MTPFVASLFRPWVVPVLLAGSLLTPSGSHAERIWRYVDAHGQVVYSNQPPPASRGKATVIDTPKYAPPAPRTGPSWAQVFGTDGSGAAASARPSLDSAERLPSPAFSTSGQGPLPPGFRLPPSGDAQPLPPLPGDVRPPVQMPWPTVTPPSPQAASSPPASVPDPAHPAHATPTAAASAAGVGLPASTPHAASSPVVPPVHPPHPSPVSSHPASAPVAAHPDSTKP